MTVIPEQSQATRKRLVNIGDKEEQVKSSLTSFFKNFIREEPTLKKYFDVARVRFLGAGVFGHVFSIKAVRDLTYSDLDNLTKVLTKDEMHKTFNRVVQIKIANPNEVILRRQTEVAMKCETAFLFQPEDFPVRQHNLPKIDYDRYAVYKEYNALCQICNRYGYANIRGFTKPYAFGRLGNFHDFDSEENQRAKLFGFHFLIFEMCGPDMEELMNACSYDCKQMDQKLSSRTVMMIGDQLLARLQTIQEPQLAFLHNDLKNDQLMIGRYAYSNTIYLIDYGLVTNYMDDWGKSDLPPIGNRRWAPRSNHLEKPRTPLCEMESACYLLLRLLRNHFPWDGLFDLQMQRVAEMREKGEDVTQQSTGDQVLYEVKQALWMHLRQADPTKQCGLKDANGDDIDMKAFFDDRTDKWGDGAPQLIELMLEMGKICGHKEFFFWENLVSYENISYMDIRKHLLSMFDLSMYSHNLESAGLTDAHRMKLTKFFVENKAANEARTECGRPVYFYFPEGEQVCYFEWYCRAVQLWENKPAYWHKLLANREELLTRLREKKKGKAIKEKVVAGKK